MESRKETDLIEENSMKIPKALKNETKTKQKKRKYIDGKTQCNETP